MRCSFTTFPKLILIALLAVFPAFGQKSENAAVPVIDVNFCDLIENPETYKDKTVRVRATYQTLAGGAKIYCIDCLDVSASWVEFDEKFKKAAPKALRKKIEAGGVMNAALVGKFSAGGRYGAENLYASRFIVENVSEVEVLSKNPEDLTVRARAKFYCQKKD